MAIDRTLTPYSINSYDPTVSGVNDRIKNQGISGVSTLGTSADPSHPSYRPPDLEAQQIAVSQNKAQEEFEKQALDPSKLTIDPTQTIV